MAILPIYVYPHPVLKEKAHPIDAVTDDIRQLMDDMAETMTKAPGIGLAATQVGRLERVIVMYTDMNTEDEQRQIDKESLIQLANPEIISASDTLQIEQEGCLSIPSVYTDIERPDHVVVRALNYEGDEVELEFSGLAATCLQHEIDHLDGILFPDHISKLRQKMLWKKYNKGLSGWKETAPYPFVEA